MLYAAEWNRLDTREDYMSKEKRLEELRRIEEELIKEAEGSIATDDSSESNPTHEPVTDALEPSESDAAGSSEGVAKQDDSDSDSLSAWKEKALDAQYRFSKFKAKTDATIYKLRVENKELREKIIELNDKLDAKMAPVDSSSVDTVFTPSVVDVLGEEAVDAIKTVIRSTEEKVAATEKKLKESEKKRTVEKMQEDAVGSYETFVSSLKELVPDCLVLNDNPLFLEWLDQPDFTGVPRIDRLRSAQKDGDVERVASFFTLFKSQQKAPVEKPKDSISNRMGPGQKSTSTELPKETGDTVSVSFIKQHELNVSKGKFKGREAEKREIDKRIEQAYLTGRIVQ